MLAHLPKPLDIQGLDTARVAPFGGWDVYADVFFSTLVYPLAGQPIGQPLIFFAGNEGLADKTLTNVANANALIPGGHKFHGLKLFLYPLIEAAAVPVPATLDGTGLVRDVDRVFKTNRPIVSYTSTKLNKSRGTIPGVMIGEVGGILPDFGGNNAPAAGNNAIIQHARLAPLGGWDVDLPVYENEGITVQVVWGAATGITANMNLQAAIVGWHYVQVG